MYRTPDTRLRCPRCGGSAITPPTACFAHDGYATVHFHRTDTQTDESYRVDRATVCLDCGHVAFGFSTKTLAWLKNGLSRLEPKPEDY